ncbi:MAG TPA: formylglycine-generating enzyme family protein [Mariprofundaceae bacterium]|nr:formylglycine-generating enzyme family protein [Mariprofundaceae bacterium]
MKRPELSPRERKRRKQLLTATLITCIAAAMIGGSLHVMDLGILRLHEMRAKASYDPADMQQHIRAAGEEIYVQEKHEEAANPLPIYTPEEVKALLTPAQWKEVGSMVEIPAGVFTMGTNSPQANDENKPEHQVRLHAYRIDKYPVTQAQYAQFVAEKRYRPPLNWEGGKIPPGLNMHPVTMVSWYNAQDYCAWAGKRLPSEAEWEKAARGTDARRWPWGNGMKPENLNTYYQVGHTTPVDHYPAGASPYGVIDMAGNVQEWVADVLAPYPGSSVPGTVFEAKVVDPHYKKGAAELEKEQYRVMRGGSWKGDPFSTTTYHRNYSLPNYASDFFGFRCAEDVPAGKRK